ncbi:MAG: hypothetical protein H0V80_03860 [Acidobacteria bacterium]|nr:hypothetical protein [Acidobacteriota bacterium]
MPFVAILGAGPLGGALASGLAASGRFDELRLIDPEKTVASGKALDILQAAPVEGTATRLSGSATLDAAGGAWVSVLADPAGSTAPDLARTLALVRDLHRRSPQAVLICANTSHHLLMARAVATGAIAPDRVVGSAPLAFASAARALIALDADVSPSQVLVHVATVGPALGRPPCAVQWERSSIGGDRASECLTHEQRARIERRLARSWPTGPVTLAAAAAQFTEAAWFGARTPLPGWWVDNGGVAPPDVHLLRFAPGGRVSMTRASTGAGR